MSYDDEIIEEAPREGRGGAYAIAGAVIGALLAAVTTFVVVAVGSHQPQDGKQATEVINYNG